MPCASRSATRCTATTSRRTRTRSRPGLGWVCARDKQFTRLRRARAHARRGPAAPARRAAHGRGARRAAARVPDPRRRGRRRRRGHERDVLAHAPARHRPGLRAVRAGRRPTPPSPSTCAGARARRTPRASRCTSRRPEPMPAAESYPDDLRYHREHDWARVDGDTATFGVTWYAQDSLGDLVVYLPPEAGAEVRAGARVRRARVGQGRVGHRRAALGHRDRGQPGRDRRARARQRRSLRPGLADPRAALRPRRARRACSTRRPTPHTWRASSDGAAGRSRARRPVLAAAHRALARGSGAHARAARARLARRSRARGGARLDPARQRSRPARGAARDRRAGRAARARAPQPRDDDDDRPRLLRHAHAAGRAAQGAREPGLVHGLHALPAGDLAGPPGGAAQLPDDGLRPDGRCRSRTPRCSTRPRPRPRR